MLLSLHLRCDRIYELLFSLGTDEMYDAICMCVFNSLICYKPLNQLFKFYYYFYLYSVERKDGRLQLIEYSEKVICILIWIRLINVNMRAINNLNSEKKKLYYIQQC